MDTVDSMQETARELVTFARTQGCDLEPNRFDCMLQNERRWIYLWRKDGLLHYNMQGAIEILPSQLKEPASAFRGAWGESGTFDDMERAVEFVKAWLIENKEVDDLPHRRVRQYGI